MSVMTSVPQHFRNLANLLNVDAQMFSPPAGLHGRLAVLRHVFGHSVVCDVRPDAFALIAVAPRRMEVIGIV